MMKDKLKWSGIISRFNGKLVKMIKDVNGRFDHYSTLPKIRKFLLHWGYEFAENDLLWFIFFVHIKWVIISSITNNYCKKQKKDIIIVVVKRRLLNIILLIKKFWEKMHKINIERCLKKKKK